MSIRINIFFLFAPSYCTHVSSYHRCANCCLIPK